MLIWSQVAFHHGLVTTTSPRKLWRPWCARGFRGHLRVRFWFLHANLWWIYAALCGRTLKGEGDAGGFRGGSLCWEVWDEWYAGRLLLYIIYIYIINIISVILTITIAITIILMIIMRIMMIIMIMIINMQTHDQDDIWYLILFTVISTTWTREQHKSFSVCPMFTHSPIETST